MTHFLQLVAIYIFTNYCWVIKHDFRPCRKQGSDTCWSCDGLSHILGIHYALLSSSFFLPFLLVMIYLFLLWNLSHAIGWGYLSFPQPERWSCGWLWSNDPILVASVTGSVAGEWPTLDHSKVLKLRGIVSQQGLRVTILSTRLREPVCEMGRDVKDCQQQSEPLVPIINKT